MKLCTLKQKLIGKLKVLYIYIYIYIIQLIDFDLGGATAKVAKGREFFCMRILEAIAPLGLNIMKATIITFNLLFICSVCDMV